MVAEPPPSPAAWVEEDAKPTVIQWVVDTRPLWPEATQTKHLEQHAARALALLTPKERQAVSSYYHVRDAKLSLASHLLKRYVVSRYCCVPWPASIPVSDPETGKPGWRDAQGHEPLRFNVSHQDGLVALLAVRGYPRDRPLDVGVDVVSPLERADRERASLLPDPVAAFPAYVDIYAEVLAQPEMRYLCEGVLAHTSPIRDRPGPGAPPRKVADFLLRCFHTLWCLREAYVKMTGEALVAPWLKELEFRAFRPPAPGLEGQLRDLGGEVDDATVIREHEIYFRGERVEDANVCLRALGPDHIVCAAVRTPECKEDGLALRLGDFESVSIDEMVQFGEAHGGA